ncbi:hypothetical protein [Cytobacillus sp. NCCP-133]|uniref:hypothetical protein n=1 Tax=Cytobacillus sp. NCCP-133 TaxID=766848 RepID=UPI00223268B7|nr:hypothetical protein [Cytobacillus sp. NCCP-133]GLB61112.1 hypothetical protein NCCP133_32420 [Cytobacillus sp. NCCP-133]
MKDILILGGTQFFGIGLVEKLVSEGKNVTITNRGRIRIKDPFDDKVVRLMIGR